MASKGKLITLEGIDGTGKSSMAKMLKNRFPDAVFTREPTHSWIGNAVKRSIESETDPLAELFLFVADHAEHISRIVRPALKEGKLVFSDRYSDSRYAYQGVTLSNIFDDAMGFVQSIHKGWTVIPDMTILFKIDPMIAVSRCTIRGEKTKYEKIEFLRTVQANLLKLAEKEPDRFVIIDAGQDMEKVEKDVEKAVNQFLVDNSQIDIAVSRGLVWLKTQEPHSIKDISRLIQALSMWNEHTSALNSKLISLKKDGFWETETPVNDTARACIALSGCESQTEIIQWIQEEQKNDNWNNNEIDTAYALMALGYRGIKNEDGCQWLISNYGKKWEHPGTTSLIITALAKQDKIKYGDFIKDRANWLISKREDGGWTYIATSNLVIQALILSDLKKHDILPSIAWLLGKQEENGSWRDLISTSLTLITLKLYLDKFNRCSDK